jgi:hypothetical protein
MIYPNALILSQEPVALYGDIRKSLESNIDQLYRKVGNKANLKPQIQFFYLGSESSSAVQRHQNIL